MAPFFGELLLSVREGRRASFSSAGKRRPSKEVFQRSPGKKHPPWKARNWWRLGKKPNARERQRGAARSAMPELLFWAELQLGRGTRARGWAAGGPVSPVSARKGSGRALPARQGELAGCSVRLARAGCVRLGSGRRPRCRAKPPRSGPLSTLASLPSYLLPFPFCGQGFYLISTLSSSISFLASLLIFATKRKKKHGGGEEQTRDSTAESPSMGLGDAG